MYITLCDVGHVLYNQYTLHKVQIRILIVIQYKVKSSARIFCLRLIEANSLSFITPYYILVTYSVSEDKMGEAVFSL